jgi:hypothetical protein
MLPSYVEIEDQGKNVLNMVQIAGLVYIMLHAEKVLQQWSQKFFLPTRVESLTEINFFYSSTDSRVERLKRLYRVCLCLSLLFVVKVAELILYGGTAYTSILCGDISPIKNVLNKVTNGRHSLHYAAHRKSFTAMVTKIFLAN